MAGLLWHRVKRIAAVIMVALICCLVHAQDTDRKGSRYSAFDAFSKGNYEDAYTGFSQLLVDYPMDPLYRYYAGISLVKMMQDPGKASGLLKEAAEGPSDLKPVPVDVWFYLGRAQQMAANYSDALISYNTFSGKAGRKRAKEYEVQKYIRECNERKGELTGFEIIQAGLEEKPASSASDILVAGSAENKTDVPEDLPPELETALVRGMDYQQTADSLLAEASALRKQLEAGPDDQKAAARKKVAEMESKAAAYQKQSDQAFGTARPDSGIKTTTIISSGEGSYKEEALEKQPAAVKTEAPLTSRPPVPDIATDGQKTEVYSMFEVISDQRKIAEKIIEIDPVLPAGLVYRLQIAVFSKPVDPETFKGIAPVSGFSVQGSNVKRYYAGMFRKARDAGKALLAVKQLGFRDAFLTAVMNGEPVSLDRATLLEKEWGNRPLIVKEKPVDMPRQDPVPQTLTFRVEIARSAKPANDETVAVYRKIAGNRGMNIISTSDGSFAYLIGKFITFESAFEYSDLLVRNGYRDAKVTAWIGESEIDVETAKMLFEKHE